LNIEEYISSGILEAYVLGELSEQERIDVEKNLAQYPQLREELQAIEETQEQLLMSAAIKPRIQVKDSLFQRIDQQKPEAKVVPLIPESDITSDNNIWKYAAAASVVIALVSSYLAYDYHSKWKHTENSLTELIAQNQRVAKDYNVVNERLDKIESDLKVIDNPAFQRVIMKGTDNAPQSMAYVYWNASSQEVYLSIQSMKELSKENQYQLWAIIDGKPVDAGVFDGNVAGLLKMKAIGTGAAAFAVTVEPRGGKPTPSLETMQVVGNVVKG
jgi:anti-sigma-K factor RskA